MLVETALWLLPEGLACGLGEKANPAEAGQVDLDSGWNGQYHSETCVPGVYTYWAEVELINGKHWIIKGDVTLVR